MEIIKKQHWNIPLCVETTLLVICIKEKKNLMWSNGIRGTEFSYDKSDLNYFE